MPRARKIRRAGAFGRRGQQPGSKAAGVPIDRSGVARSFQEMNVLCTLWRAAAGAWTDERDEAIVRPNL
jgi:hypothetical protein